ncbi:MAG: hypothetical protein ACE5JP_07130 [Candidatus Bipolaricaulia bacterium]
MSNQGPPTVTVAKDIEFLPPKKEQGIPITISDWSHLKTRIRRLGIDSLLFHTIGSVILGFAGSALIAALTLPQRVEPTESEIVIWVIFVAALFIGVLSLYFAHQTRGGVLDEMRRLEAMYVQPTDEGGATMPQRWRLLSVNTPDFSPRGLSPLSMV